MSELKGNKILIAPVAYVRSPFQEKFGIPRQAGLVDDAVGEVVFVPPFDDAGMLDGLEGFSHVWLLFRFSACADRGWRPRVRPPRLGGNREVGVWASRSPFRPNGLGLSAVRLLDVVTRPRPLLRVGGIDLLDGTPVVDVKPYLPYADAIADAAGGFADAAPPAGLAVRFASLAENRLAGRDDADALRRLITGVLALDPRPAYRQIADGNRVYGMHLCGLDVRWAVDDDGVEVCDLAPVADD